MPTHSEMVTALIKSPKTIQEEITSFDAGALHMAIGISGEAGELLDAIKKGAIYRKEYDRKNIIEELGDIEFYLEGIRQHFDIPRELTLDGNIEKLSVRYATGKFSNQQAQERADKSF